LEKSVLSENYELLGLKQGASADEIKKAYRKKAREFHPDINHSPDAKDMFIKITEAYEFLLSYSVNISLDEESFNNAMDDWRKYRQNRARYRANIYAQTSYNSFKNTNFYKTTRIFDGTTIIFSLTISVIVLLVTVFGYIYRIHHPIPGLKNPSVGVLITLILFGMFLFLISYIYLKAYILSSSKKNRHEKDD
jgi:hypothetical protein